MRKFSTNIIFNLLSTFVTLLFPLITFPYISRVLGVENLGVIQYYISIISYFILLASLGVPFYAIKQGAKYRDKKDDLSVFFNEITYLLIISTFLSYITLLIIIIIADGLNSKLLILISLQIIFTSLNSEWFFQLKEQYVYLSIRSLIIKLVSLLALFIFVKNESDIYIYALINVLMVAAMFCMNWYALFKDVTFKKSTFKGLKKHLGPIFLIFFSTISTTIYMNIDVVMLGSIINAYAVGIYIVAVKLNQAVKMLISSISTIMVSRMSYYAGVNEKDKFEKLLKYTVNLIYFILMPIVVVLVMLSDNMIILFSGKDFLEANFASKILSINILFSIIDSIIYYQILLPLNKEKNAALATTVGALSNVLLNIVFIPLYSYNGAAITTLVSEIMVFIILVYYASKEIKISAYIYDCIPYLLSSLPIILISIVLKNNINNHVLVVLLTITFSSIIYLCLIFIIKKKEFIIIKNAFLNKKRIN